MLDAGGWVPVPGDRQTNIGSIQQSAADEIEGHNIRITRESTGVTKSESFSVCVHRSLWTQGKRTADHMEVAEVGKRAEIRNMLVLMQAL